MEDPITFVDLDGNKATLHDPSLAQVFVAIGHDRIWIGLLGDGRALALIDGSVVEIRNGDDVAERLAEFGRSASEPERANIDRLMSLRAYGR